MALHLTILQMVLSLISGGLVGFTLGLIGGGGSIMAVPLLLYMVGIDDPHIVIGSTALAVSVNAYINLISHWRTGNVNWRAAISFAIPGAIGAYIGSIFGKQANGKELLFLFAILMLVITIIMLKPQKSKHGTADFRVNLKKVIPSGFGTGLVSGFFGIGGGFLIVPGLVFSTGMPIIMAIGSSLFSVGTFGLTTAISYAASGLVNWLVVLLYIVGGIFGGIIGTKTATKLSKNKQMLQYIFSGIIIVVACYMLYVNIHAL